ncbi:helix-turn-helix transcriptional regulator [Limosilactobacillus mucosae]|uniref:helix-turn-helix transcriptional regulator n=1 Tax=Limosilactobacillus mucosae TaxID=97478 RepID=UPI0015D66D15|nr:helix-turn-helix transcriptional regulator [Limosilactobacillus mucosae]
MQLTLDYFQRVHHCPISTWQKSNHCWAPEIKNPAIPLNSDFDINRLGSQCHTDIPLITGTHGKIIVLIKLNRQKLILIGPVSADQISEPHQTFLEGVCLIQNLISATDLHASDLISQTRYFQELRQAQQKSAAQHLFNAHEASFRHNPYDEEQLKKALNESFTGSYGTLAQNPLCSFKNLAIVDLGLIARAAIKGGMNYEDSFSLNDAYIQSIENARTADEVYSITVNGKFEYLRLVKKIQQQSLASDHPLVQRVKAEVAVHLHEPLTVAALASHLHVTPNYLSALFKTTTEMPLKSYLNLCKINASQNELVYSSLPISQIAVNYAFASASHYDQTFNYA